MPNRLINETSPYLLQHAHNPVDWYPYGEEAFAAARERNRPLLISIGYSACHWCHVMEHESFSKPEIAEVMNRLFVCVKVDREERPDVDLLYMNAVQLLHNSGGWPLNCFALPDGSPFWGGTYFRPAQWADLLIQISDLYDNSHEELKIQASRLMEGISGQNMVEAPANPSGIDRAYPDETYEQLSLRFDGINGGMTGAPKFPMPVVWQFVLDYYDLSGKTEALDYALKTLRAMAMGGIYDQIGGGFARYSTDAHWKVPHFEKMLYDNAQLISLYAKAFRISGHKELLEIIQQSISFTNVNSLLRKAHFMPRWMPTAREKKAGFTSGPGMKSWMYCRNTERCFRNTGASIRRVDGNTDATSCCGHLPTRCLLPDSTSAPRS